MATAFAPVSLTCRGLRGGEGEIRCFALKHTEKINSIPMKRNRCDETQRKTQFKATATAETATGVDGGHEEEKKP